MIGSGLSSLTVAWDSIRKGYGVRILQPRKALAEILIERYPEGLSREVLEEEKALLMGLGVEIELEALVDERVFPDRSLRDFGAIYLGMDAVSVDSWELEREADGRIPDQARRALDEPTRGLCGWFDPRRPGLAGLAGG